MKKTTLVSILTLISAMFLLSACNNSDAVSTPTPIIHVEAMELGDTNDAIISDYLNEYSTRNTFSFLTEDEKTTFNSMGYNIISDNIISDPNNSNKELYYPLLFKEDNGSLVVIGVNEYGNLDCPDNDIFNLHTAGTAVAGDCLMSSPDGQIYYDYDASIVQYWSYGELSEQFKVPTGAVYAGYSFWEGYIFRHNTDVYSVFDGFGDDTIKVHPIAHNVQMVLSTDYSLTSDSWSQPLFLMTDGTIKSYVGWSGNQDVSDDVSHLVEVSKDGGYTNTYYPYNE